MNLPRRAVIGLATVAILGAALLLLIPRIRTAVNPASDNAATSSAGGDSAAGSADASPETRPVPTSEDLIAEALAAGRITYEASLLERAYALFDDPRLDRAFRSPVVHWEAALLLFHEVDVKENTLSNGVLEALAPFRVRPSDPASIVNRPRADVVKAQLSRHGEWEGVPVAGTRIRLWNKGPLARRDVYEQMIRDVWRVYPSYFSYPLADSGTFATTVDPDSAIDLYLVDGQALDPRTVECQREQLDQEDIAACSLRTDRGVAFKTPSSGGGGSSGYFLVNRRLSDADVLDTIAHELAHVSQVKYDPGETLWLMESTATWVAYKVMKRLQRTPEWEYGWLKYRNKPPDLGEFFNALHMNLDFQALSYSAWLFFYYASMEKGNGVVTEVWERAAASPLRGLAVVNDVVPMDAHFRQFALRNWNQETVPNKYETTDGNFPRDAKPLNVFERPFHAPATHEIGDTLLSLSSAYYRFTFEPVIRTVTFQSLRFSLPAGSPRPHVWAIKNVRGTWKDPEDWTEDGERVFCRDEPTEDLTELILIVSNSDLTRQLPRQPKLRVVGEAKGCPYLRGWGKSTLRLKDDVQDLTYVSSQVPLTFRPRTVQDETTGNVEYDLLPTSVTWRVNGRRHDCKVEGESIVNLPLRIDADLDPTLPAFGYMNVVGLKNGDYHSVQVSARPPDAMTVTCPGDPPIVTKALFGVQWLLNVLHQTNTHESGGIIYKGKQTFDPARIQNNLPMSPDSALSNLLTSPGRGFITPEIQRQLKEAQGALDRIAAERGGQFVYTFEWELKP